MSHMRHMSRTKRTKRTVLAVDIGTSSLKAALIDFSGSILAHARCRFPQGERTAAHWISAFESALGLIQGDMLKISDPFLPAAFSPDAISISGNGPTLVSVDSSGKPGPILLWNSIVEPIPVRSLFIPRIKAYKTRFAAEFSSAQYLLSGPEFLMWYLTGNAVTILPDPRYEVAYWTAEELEIAGLSAAAGILPPFVSTGVIAGKTKRFKMLPQGIPVVSCGPDFTAALIGTNTLTAGAACDRAGTSEGLNVCTDSRITAVNVRTLPAAVPDLWNASYIIPDTGARFHVWRKESGLSNKSYPEIMKSIAGADGGRAIVEGGRAIESGRAIVEEIGFSVRDGIECLRAATGFNPHYRLSGGQARNHMWNQMKANITGATFSLTKTADGELMGDAIAGFVALGEFSSLAEGAEKLVTDERLYEPDPILAKIYTEKYAEYAHLQHS